MSTIKIKCPDCAKEIKIEVHTIDKLKQEVEDLKRERDFYKSKLAGLELKNKVKPDNPFSKIWG